MSSIYRVLIGSWRLLRMYWCSEEYIYARSISLVVLLLELISVGLEVILTYWFNAFINMFQLFDQASFFRLIVYFSFLLIAMTVASVLKQYLSQTFQLRWRRWLTNEFLNRYLSQCAYYRISLLGNQTQTNTDQNDNPDQRISMDIQVYIENTCVLALGALHTCASLVSHIIVLWSVSGVIEINVTQRWSLPIYGSMVWTALLYAGIGTLVINHVGRALFKLKYTQEHYEANFRYGLVRLRDHAEAVALYRSESNEHEILTSLFQKVMSNFQKLIYRKLIFNWFDSLYNLTVHIVPFLIAYRRYFSKAITLGDLLQISMSYNNVHKSLAFITDSYDSIVSWRSATKRLVEFLDTLSAVQAAMLDSKVKFIHLQEGKSMQIEQLTVLLPLRVGEKQQQIIINNLDLVLESHQSVLITGESGCGKSTFLRTLAGVWPHASGTVKFPAFDTFAFLPQKPYCPLGSLRRCLIYPLDSCSPENDDNIERLLVRCQMDHWCSRLNEIQDWSTMLSLGEQQKMAMIRILLLRPKWIFLDEATSSLDENAEVHFYSILFAELRNHSTIVSIGHRAQLRAFHRIELAFHNGRIDIISLSNEERQNLTKF